MKVRKGAKTKFSLSAVTHVAPLGLGVFGNAIFYKHVAPLGLCGFIGALSRDMNLDLREVIIVMQIATC